MQSLFFRFNEQTGFNIEANKPSNTILQAMAALNIDDDGEDNIFSRLVINKPEEFQNKSFMAHLRDLPWGEKVFTQQVEEILYREKHRTFCKLQDSSPAMVIFIILLIYQYYLNILHTKNCWKKIKERSKCKS